jgi:phosphatidylserine/phosphatidylglycerophosphate/cardiolipin synthase-like enzyme/uncharacterized membrane protein YdjX (TVP38/TMEM64 family)
MSEPSNAPSLFQPGRNCWQVARSARAAFLVDADAYFKSFVAAARNARRSILLIGWDFHSRTRLLCHDGQCEELEVGAFLNDLVKRRPQLHVHILIWDYPMIFGIDREWAPLLGLGWKPHRRIHFRYDNTHPVGGSHHQKIAVIDDAVAFNGGIDITYRRWDTCAHDANDRLRTANGAPYPPFHDLMMVLDGPAARALGDLARERWRNATGETLQVSYERRQGWRHRLHLPSRRRADDTPADPWPTELPVSVANVDVAISRTAPAIEGEQGIREVEALYLDMIAAAKHSIYIENQYFTAEKAAEALASRLQEPDGPEVIVVLRELSHGWLEEITMQTLRTRLIEKLRAADRHERLRVVFPWIAGLKEGTCIDVHSKMMIVDDDIVRIGSANFANRSMGLDTECDTTIEAAGREDVRSSIRALRACLLGEHLGFSTQEVQHAIAATASLRGALDALQRPDRTLRPLPALPQVPDAVMSIVAAADPESPVALSDLTRLFAPDEVSGARRNVWLRVVGIAAGVGCLAALWKFTPLADFLDPQRVTDWARRFGHAWWAPLAVIAAYTPACLTMFPRPLITLFAVVAFGPWLGFAYAMTGVEFAAWVTYVAGQRLDRGTVRRLAGRKLNRIVDVLRRRGLTAMTALRLVPLAPFALEGIVAGAVRIKPWHFLAGTALGMLPGTLATTVFGNELQALFGEHRSVNYWLIAGAVALLASATWAVRRWLMKSAIDPSSSVSPRPASQQRVGSARTA